MDKEAAEPQLPPLSAAQLEILLQALTPSLDASNPGGSELDDAGAFIARLGLHEERDCRSSTELRQWLNHWTASGGNQKTLAIAIRALQRQQQLAHPATDLDLVWSGPDWGIGAETRDQSILIQQLVKGAQRRLLLSTYAFYQGPFIRQLFQWIQEQLAQNPFLEVRIICNINRKHGDTRLEELLISEFKKKVWEKLWGSHQPGAKPILFYDPRSVRIGGGAVSHAKAVISDDHLLVTSANLTDAAQLKNFELGVHVKNREHANSVWVHFEQLINKGMLLPAYPQH